MAKLFSSPSEVLALKAICSKDRAISGYVLASVDETYFHNEPAVEAYEAIIKHMGKSGMPPAFTFLQEDLGLSSEARDFLKLTDKKQVRKQEQAEQLVSMLGEYRKTRLLFKLGKGILRRLQQDQIDVDDLVESVTRRIVGITSFKSTDNSLFHIGKDSNVRELIEEIIYSDDTSHIIPTGFKAYDSVNGGFRRGALVLLGGATSSGKCQHFDTEISLSATKTIKLGAIWDSETSGEIPDEDDPCGSLKVLSQPLTVLTHEGPRTVEAVYRTRGKFKRITLSDGTVLRALDNHRFMGEENWIYVSQMQVGHVLTTREGTATVRSILQETETNYAYDIQVPGPESYYANGVLSHNSLLMNQLALNQASLGYKINMVPLEMDTSELLSRSISNVSGIDASKIQNKRLASNEKELAFKRWRRAERRIAKANGRITVFKPQSDMTIEEIANALHSIKSDVNYIDYVGLLKGADGEDQWRRLGQIARFAKIHAELTGKCMVLLAQVDQEGQVRYSRAMVEHASTSWIFVATRETREAGYLQINMNKGRNEQLISFTIKMDYSTQSAKDLSPEEMDAVAASATQDTSAARGSKARKGRGSAKKQDDDYLPDLTSDSV